MVGPRKSKFLRELFAQGAKGIGFLLFSYSNQTSVKVPRKKERHKNVLHVVDMVFVLPFDKWVRLCNKSRYNITPACVMNNN